MIKGAVDGKHRLNGQYSPEEFGRITLWQMKNLYGYGGSTQKQDAFTMFRNARKLRGESEWTIYDTWKRESEALKEQANV